MQLATCALLLAGIGLSFAFGVGRGLGPGRWAVLLAATAASLVPPVTRFVFASLERIRHPSPKASTRAVVAIGLLAAAYFVATAVHQDRDLFPKTHDDQSYLLQMQMLARGRLWMPEHPLADFFDTFYVLVRPKYASMYFPGAALLYVLTLWLHLPTWLMPALVAGAIVGLVYRLVTDIMDGVAGALAAVLMVSLSWFRMFSVLLTSHEPVLLMGLLLVWAWLRWRQVDRPRRKAGWLVAMGVFAGWAAITRPVDAICYAVPVGAALLLDLRRRPAREWVTAGGLLVAGAVPFLAVQLVANRGITGDWFTTPFRLYLDQSQPGTALGFHPLDPTLRPTSRPPQKQNYYDTFYVPFIRRHQRDTFLASWRGRYLPQMVDTTLPARALLVFLPVGLLGIAITARQRRAAWVVVSILPAFVLLYMMYTIFLEHYALLVAPSVLLLVVAGGRALETTWPRARRAIAAAFAVAVVVLCASVLPDLNGLWGERYAVSDETFPSPLLRGLHETLPNLEHRPAVVLFHYTGPSATYRGDKLWEEPVYNSDVAWPDDAPVVRAHDLGPERNRRIIDYYAARQPDRFFYRFDAATGGVEEMGTARDLAAARH